MLQSYRVHRVKYRHQIMYNYELLLSWSETRSTIRTSSSEEDKGRPDGDFATVSFLSTEELSKMNIFHI